MGAGLSSLSHLIFLIEGRVPAVKLNSGFLCNGFINGMKRRSPRSLLSSILPAMLLHSSETVISCEQASEALDKSSPYAHSVAVAFTIGTMVSLNGFL